jgi:hypothetical protein
MTDRMTIQFGQGLIESLLVLATLLVLLCSTHRTGELRHLTLIALYESTLTVFRERGFSSFTQGNTQNAETRNSIENELLGRDSGMFIRGVDVQHIPTQNIGRFRQIASNISSVARISYLYAGVGRSMSEQDVHISIGSAKRTWRSASAQSARVARRAALNTRPIDSVWRRASPQFDWLSAWTDVVPRASVRAHK